MAARQTDVFTVSRPDDLDEIERRLAEEDLDELPVRRLAEDESAGEDSSASDES